MKTKKILSIIFAFVMCLGIVACGNNTGNTQTKDNDTEKENSITDNSKSTSIVLSESWDFNDYYPVTSPSSGTSYNASYWAECFYDTLVEYDENGEIIPNLASSWTISDDGMTYTFTLREDVLFSDGTPLTASAVVTSFKKAIEILGMYAGSYGKLSGCIADVQAPDDYTVVLVTTQPYYNTLGDLTMNMLYAVINPAAFVGGDEASVRAACASATMGSGPYMYSETTEDGPVFVLNPYYWGDKPDVESFTVKTIADNDAKLLALKNGEIDALLTSEDFSADGFIELQSDASFGTLIDDTSSQTRYLGFNLNRAPFNDVNVRLAVAYAIDQQLLSNAAFNGLEEAAELLYSETMIYCGESGAKGYATDTEKAKAILEDAGWVDSDGDGIREKDGTTLSIELSYTKSLATVDNAILTIKSELEAIGFSVTANAPDMMVWYTNVMMGEFDIAFWFSNGGVYDPTSGMSNIISPADPVLYQYQNFINGGADIIVELDSTTSMDRVQEIYNSVLKDINDMVLLVPVTYTKQLAVWNAEKIASYNFSLDARYITVQNIKLK